MAISMRTNWRKNTRTAYLNTNINGRDGVTNYAGHASAQGIGIHVSVSGEPDRPVSVLLSDLADIDAIRELIAEYDRQKAAQSVQEYREITGQDF